MSQSISVQDTIFIGEAGGDGAYVGMGAGFILAGAVSWAGFYFSGKYIERKYEYSVQSFPIFEREFKFGNNDRLMVGINLLKGNNTLKNKTLGLGVSYNF